MTYLLFKLPTMVLKINATVAFQNPPEEIPALADCVLSIIKDVLLFVAGSHGVGRRRTTHLRRGSRGHREPPVHRRRVHPDDVSAGQGHGKARGKWILRMARTISGLVMIGESHHMFWVRAQPVILPSPRNQYTLKH